MIGTRLPLDMINPLGGRPRGYFFILSSKQDWH